MYVGAKENLFERISITTAHELKFNKIHRGCELEGEYLHKIIVPQQRLFRNVFTRFRLGYTVA